MSVEAAASASLDSVIVTYASETTGHATTAYLALQTPIAQYQAIAVGSLLINVATGTNVIRLGHRADSFLSLCLRDHREDVGRE